MLGVLAVLIFTTGMPVWALLIGTASLFSVGGWLAGLIDTQVLSAVSGRILGLLEHDLLQALSLYVFVGVLL
jgi:TRAP-type mannitol/chloroaromatic compound transport system permease large subunit